GLEALICNIPTPQLNENVNTKNSSIASEGDRLSQELSFLGELSQAQLTREFKKKELRKVCQQLGLTDVFEKKALAACILSQNRDDSPNDISMENTPQHEIRDMSSLMDIIKTETYSVLSGILFADEKRRVIAASLREHNVDFIALIEG
ncbi:hypothetical protein SK128_007116, partial [Halocaridina rubra]